MVDDDRAGERHDGDHHREARLRGDERRDDARPAQQLAQRRGGARPRGVAVSWRSSAAIRVGSGRTQQTSASPAAMKPPGGEPQRRERVAVELAAGEQRAEDAGPEDRAEDRAEQHERDPAGAALGRVHVAGRGAREQRGRVRGADEHEPAEHRGAPASPALPSAARPQPAIPAAKPAASTGTRPKRSMSRPAGSATSAPDASTIAGPSPSSPSTCSTRTSVSDATAAASWSVAEFVASEPDSSAVLRRMGSASAGGTAGERTRGRALARRAPPAARLPRQLRVRRLGGGTFASCAGSPHGSQPPPSRSPAPPARPRRRSQKTTTSYATIGGDPAAPYSRLRLMPGWKRVVRDDLATPRKGRLKRRTLAAVLRPAVGLPARRRGVARARRGARHRRLAVRVGLAPAGGARAVHRRRGRAPGQPLRRQPAAQPRPAPRPARADDHDRRLRRQPAGQRGQVGRAAARGRPPEPELRRRGRRLRRARRPARRGRALHRRPGRAGRARVRPLL